jgi:hypothetical protein
MKRGATFVLSILSVGLAVTALFLYVSLARPTVTAQAIAESTGTLDNPVYPLTTDQALAQFNSTFVLHALYLLDASYLHELPLTHDAPRFHVIIDGVTYGVEVKKGVISVVSQPFSRVDLALITTRRDLIAFLRDPSSEQDSLMDGTSTIVLFADKSELLGKGYAHFFRRLFSTSTLQGIIELVRA